MSYELILSKSEREAIDWVGDRYATGDAFYKCLLKGRWMPDQMWGDEVDLTFLIPEHIAWEIKELFEQEEMRFPCFASPFAAKLLNFADKII
jgi:hypothetical protein